MKLTHVIHEFVEYVPQQLKPGVLYVSVQHGTVVHSCCCGCGSEVVTPLSPAGWLLVFNGKAVSLFPSIGNWSLPCQSHYFVRENRVIWATEWSESRIDAARIRDEQQLDKYIGTPESLTTESSTLPEGKNTRKKGWWWKRRDR